MTLNTSYESGDNKSRTCRNPLTSNSRKRADEVMKWCRGELSSTNCSINRIVFKKVLLHSNVPGKHQPALSRCGWQHPERAPQHLLQPRICGIVRGRRGRPHRLWGRTAMLGPSQRGLVTHVCKLERVRRQEKKARNTAKVNLAQVSMPS